MEPYSTWGGELVVWCGGLLVASVFNTIGGDVVTVVARCGGGGGVVWSLGRGGGVVISWW